MKNFKINFKKSIGKIIAFPFYLLSYLLMIVFVPILAIINWVENNFDYPYLS